MVLESLFLRTTRAMADDATTLEVEETETTEGTEGTEATEATVETEWTKGAEWTDGIAPTISGDGDAEWGDEVSSRPMRGASDGNGSRSGSESPVPWEDGAFGNGAKRRRGEAERGASVATSAENEAFSLLVEVACGGAELGSASPELWVHGAFGNGTKRARGNASRWIGGDESASESASEDVSECPRSREAEKDDGLYECDRCGRRWDGFAQCFPCVYEDDIFYEEV